MAKENTKKIVVKGIGDIVNLSFDEAKKLAEQIGLQVTDNATEDNVKQSLVVYYAMKAETANKDLTAEKEKLSIEKTDLEEQNKELSDRLKTAKEKDIDLTNEESLKNHAKDILESADKINEALMASGDRESFIRALEDQTHLEPGTIAAIFPAAPAPAPMAAPPVAQDLPVSQVITGINTRVLDQTIVDLTVNYPLMSIIAQKTTKLGTFDIFYKDYTDTDSQSGHGDVTIGDFNPAGYKQFKETYPVDTEIHKGYPILNSVLNDVALTPGLFVALVNDYAMAISRPFAKKMYSRLITFLDSDAGTNGSYDEVLVFGAGADTEAKAKELKSKIISLQTPSRANLVKKPAGAAKPLEYAMNLSNMVLVFNKEFASDYRFDVAAKTFQLGEVTYQVGEIHELDFTKLAEYSDVNQGGADAKLKDYDLLLIEKGVYEEHLMYSATTSVPTTRLKTVFHRYDKVGNCRIKSKYMLAAKAHA